MKALTSNKTMQDIADLAGVSIATVSRVFNGSPKVAQSTRDKIFEVAEKFNFHPNETARTLAASRSKLIAVIMPDISNPYFTQLLQDIEELCVANGYTMIFFNSNGDSEKEKEIVRQMIARQVDGMLITLTVVHSATIPLLKKAPFPVVLMTRTVEGLDSVGIRHTEGGGLAAAHMLSKGVREFYYFGLEDDEKFFGFREELLDNNVAPEKINIIGNQDWYFKTTESGAMILKNFVHNRLGKEKAGLFCVNDIYASHALVAARESSIKVPEQLSIVGFDDTMLCELVCPSLTSVHQPVSEIAKYSFEILMQRISEGKDLDKDEFENIILVPSLVVRNT